MFKKRERKSQIYHLNDHSEEPINLNISSKEFLMKKRRLSNNSSSLNNQFSFNQGSFTKNSFSKQNAHEETFYQSSFELKNNNTATREIEIDTDFTKDAQAIHERHLQISKDKLSGKISSDTYTGKNTSIIYAQKSERDLSRYKITGSLGPMRRPKNIRVNCRFDYAHGICKDYKETGSCGFGDSCVFLHDRGDYKSGWELEQEWDKEQRHKAKEKIKGHSSENASVSDKDSINRNNETLCGICKEEMEEPIVTNCSHYFCQSCAIKYYEKNRNCALCDKPINGLFHNASNAIEHIRKNKLKINANKDKEINSVENHKHMHNDQKEKVNEDNEDDALSYLDDRSYVTKKITKEEIDSNEIHFNFDNKRKKNYAKIQNDWLYPSDYRTYD